MGEFAIIFDGAGTLLRKYRVAKDVYSGRILRDVVSLSLIGTRRDCALVVFQLDVPRQLEGVPPDLLVSNFVQQYNVTLDVVCANSDITNEDAMSSITHDKKALVQDLFDVLREVSLNCKHIQFTGIAMVVDVNKGVIPYVLATCGDLFEGTEEVINKLKRMGAQIFIASGDAKNTLYSLALCIDIPFDRVVDIATPTVKEKLVNDLRQKCGLVIMVGDGINDIPALKAADIGILTVQQKEVRPKMLHDAADVEIENIEQLPEVVRKIIMDKSYKNNGS
ncbi:MAG TPA: HAD-IC family P-type ATPase [Candidatus Acidoferrales bacterium]|nr:HAD-IC family P-type ATPase [Candidatus Acidoferrales bacterium]